jgi:hypothetical protein
MPQPPPGRPPANRPSTVRPAGAPAPAPPSQRVPAAPARPAGSPPSQRVLAAPPPSQRVAAVPPPSQRVPAAPPPSQRVAAVPPAAKPSPGTQRVSKVPGAAAPASPPSSKAKLVKPEASIPAPMAPNERKPMTKKRLMFNLAIWLSIPLCIVVIVYQLVFNKGGKKLVNNAKGAVGVGQNPEIVGPQVTDEQKELDEIEEIRKQAGTKYAVANLDKTTEEERIKLYEQVLELDAKYRERIQKFVEDPRYQDEGHAYITAGLTEVNMRKRVVSDYLRASAPPPEEKPAEPNTRALGTITGWNGTPEKLAIIFLPKDAAPTSPEALSAEYAQTFGKTGAEIKELPVERIFELLKGDVKKSVEDAGDAKSAKMAEFAKGVEVFEGTKFSGEFGYLKQMSGYYYKEKFARAKIQIHDDRGVTAFKEYYDLILRAIGTPAKGWENVSAGLCEWKLTWRKDGVVYRVNGIGTKNGMDLTYTAYNEANWKALAEERGDKDVFEEEKQEDWGDKAPTAPPQ